MIDHETETDEWLATAKKYGLAVDVHIGGDRFGYVKQFDSSETEHNWIQTSPHDRRWQFVTESAVRNVIDRVLEYHGREGDELALRNPDDLVDELERDLPSKAFTDSD